MCSQSEDGVMRIRREEIDVGCVCEGERGPLFWLINKRERALLIGQLSFDLLCEKFSQKGGGRVKKTVEVCRSHIYV